MYQWFCKNLFLSQCRPLIPVSKLSVSEPYETYMSRSYQVTKDILSDCRNTGEKHGRAPAKRGTSSFIVLHAHGFVHCWCSILPGFPLSVGNNVLIVAHASSLEACTRQLQGRGPQSAKDFIQVVRKVCSIDVLLLDISYLSINTPCGPFCYWKRNDQLGWINEWKNKTLCMPMENNC